MPLSMPEALHHPSTDERGKFDELVSPHVPKLRSVIRRLVSHPEDTDDLTQESLLQAYEKIDTFRGDAQLSTWLCTIGTRKALDYLRKRKRWRLTAQLVGESECKSDPMKHEDLVRATSAPDSIFDVREHIAFCFTCVARTLPPDDMAALILRDVGGYATREAAQMLGVSSSVLRHRLSAARKQMQSDFDDLCTLVSKRGACWQCKSLRETFDESKRGPELPDLGGRTADSDTTYERRLEIVREAEVDQGRTQALHDLAWRWLTHTEEARASTVEESAGTAGTSPPHPLLRATSTDHGAR